VKRRAWSARARWRRAHQEPPQPTDAVRRWLLPDELRSATNSPSCCRDVSNSLIGTSSRCVEAEEREPKTSSRPRCSRAAVKVTAVVPCWPAGGLRRKAASREFHNAVTGLVLNADEKRA
jgi:hypothetical protein